MFKKYLLSFLFITTTLQAKTISESVLNQQLKNNSNYVFSNTSVDGLLSLISFGLGGSEQAALLKYWKTQSIADKAKTLSSLSENSPGLDVKVNYQVWVDQKYSLLPSYDDSLRSYFSIRPRTMNVYDPLSVVDDVNSWAAEKTNNLIKNVIDRDFITPNLITIFANAVYFKGEWKEKFDPEYTQPKEFYKAGLVDTMSNYESYNYAWNPKDKVVTLELPFKNDKYSMIIAMSANLTGVDDYEPEFSYRSGKNIKRVFKDYILNSKAVGELQKSEYGGSLSLELPKFTIDSDIKNIQDLLAKVGLSSLLKAGALSNLTNDPSVKISNILQKAKIIVNEEGAEAAAVTVGGAVVVSAETYVKMKINGPFSYMIRNNKTGEKLFEGVVTNPAK